MSYLLDTTTLAEVLRASPSPTFVRRLSQVAPNDRWTSAISVSQLLLAARRENKARLMQSIIRLVAAIRVLPYDLAAAQSFAKLRASVAAEAETDDIMIAAIACSKDYTLVTRRLDEFRHYPNLRLENWIG